MKASSRVIFLVVVVICALIAGAIGGMIGNSVTSYFPQIEKWIPAKQVADAIVKDSQTVVVEESDTTRVVDEVGPSVVSIVARQVGYDPFTGPTQQDSGIGTGFVIRKDGIILTNRHVVDDDTLDYFVVVKGQEDAPYAVQDISKDTVNDIAILRIDATGLTPVVLGDSDQIKVGQTAIAIGNALGRFSNTVTKGVVSGIGRGVSASSGAYGEAEYLDDVIQTDAALNPGNSGGPLLNVEGQVVGVNVAVSQNAENIGFAIPINAVKSTIDIYEQEGSIVRPFLGVRYSIISQDIAELRDIPAGAYVQDVVADSGADQAGIKRGDIIIKIDGNEVNEDHPLTETILNKKVGDTVTLTIWRDGEETDVTATLSKSDS